MKLRVSSHAVSRVLERIRGVSDVNIVPYIQELVEEATARGHIVVHDRHGQVLALCNHEGRRFFLVVDAINNTVVTALYIVTMTLKQKEALCLSRTI